MDIIKEILGYWLSQILEKGFYLLIVLAIGFIVLYLGNSYPRYLDAWMY